MTIERYQPKSRDFCQQLKFGNKGEDLQLPIINDIVKKIGLLRLEQVLFSYDPESQKKGKGANQ